MASTQEGTSAQDTESQQMGVDALDTQSNQGGGNGGAGGQFDEAQAEEMVKEHVASQYQMRQSKNGVVTGEDVLAILESVGLSMDVDELRPQVPDWSHVPLPLTQDLVSTVRITQNADFSSMVVHIQENVVKLGLLDWMKYKLPCMDTEEERQFKTVKLSVQVAPRHMLFISTGFVLMITGGAILALMSVLWLAQANDREKVQMTNFHLLLSSFTESFEQYFMEVHADTMVDQVDTLAKMIERQQTFRDSRIQQEMKDESILFAQLLNTVGDSLENQITATAEGLLHSLSDLFSTTSGSLVASSGLMLSDLVSMVQDWNVDAELQNWETTVRQYNADGSASMIVSSAKVDCAYGDCDYTAVPCLDYTTIVTATSSSSTPVTYALTKDVHREDVSAVALFIPTFNVTVCSAIPIRYKIAARTDALIATVADFNEIHKDKYFFRSEVLLGQAPPLGGTRATWISPRLRKEDACYSAGTCLGLDAAVITVSHTQQPMQHTAEGYSGGNDLIGAAPVKFDNLVLVFSMKEEAFLERVRNEIVDIIDYLNFNSDRTTELSIGRRDENTGVVNSQLNRFRFFDGCHGECERIPPSAVNAIRALETKGTGWKITPDYRPEPVVGAYSYVGNRLDLAVVIERDVQEIRTIGLEALISIFNDNNKKYSGSLEAQFVQRVGQLPMKTFDRHARCDNIKDCIAEGDSGVVYRSDCEHCIREPLPVREELIYLTDLKMLAECQAARGNCSGANVHFDQGAARLALNAGENGQVITTTDYRDQEVLAVVSFITNFSVGMLVKLDTEEIDGPIQEMIAQAVGAAVGIVLAGLGVLIFFSRKVLDKIEYEWLSYKEQIDAEKTKFNNMVKDVIPQCVSEEMQKGQKHAASLPFLSFVFLDICNLSERTKTWSPEMICRYLTYIFTVVERCTQEYDLHKVRMFGDTFFGVGGLGDQPTDVHSALRVARFGSVVVQLLQRKFAHYPDRIPVIEETFRDVVSKHGPAFPDCTGNYADIGHVVMPPMRIGMHYGAGTFCIIETGRTPTYEIFGPGVALAARLQATSQPNRMHISGAMKEALEKVDKERALDYEGARKTVVKGQGTVTSYFIKSANVHIPAEILDSLGIDYANLKVVYEDSNAANANEPPKK